MTQDTMSARNNRVTVLLNDEEYHVFKSVSDPDLQEGTAARRILLDRAQWLYERGIKQKQRNQAAQVDQDNGDTTYDFSDAQ